MTMPTDDFHMPLSELRTLWKPIKNLAKHGQLGDKAEIYFRWQIERRRSHYWKKRALEAERKLADGA